MSSSETIGTALMQPDGTLVLQLRAETGSTLGDAQIIYGTDHAQYQDLLKHLGPMKPGVPKPVLPWPD
jgi:hypothetical protein